MSSGTPINTTIGSLGIVGDNDNNFFNNGFGINGLAYDPSLNRLYGVAFLGYLYNIDINTGLATLIGNTQTMLRGLAYDFGTNKLWGCDVNSNLYEIDKNTGNVIDTVMCQGNFVVTTSLTYAPGILQNQQVTCYDSVQIIIHPSPFVDLGPDSAFCSNQQNILHAGTGLTSYEWQDGSSDSTYTVNAVGQYDVLVTNSWGCTDRDTIVFSNPQPLATNLNLGSDTVLCDGGVWVLQGPTGFPLTTWSDLSHGQNLTIYGPGTYWITVKDACGTLASDTVHVDAADTPVLDLGGDTIACISNQFQLHAGQGFATYLWNTTAQTESVIIDTTGTYWVKAKSDDGCWAYDTVDVQINLPFDPVVLGEDTTICTANFIRIQAPSGFESYSWNTGVQTDFIEVNSAGNYWVEVLDSSHCFSVDSIQVFFANVPSEFVIPNAFSPNGDAINDYFAWDQHYITDFQLSVFNRWGMKLYETNQVDHFWDGDNQADGTYYFIVHYTELCTNEPVEKKGFFSLLH